MNHEILKEMLEPYELGLLSKEEKNTLEAHLLLCAECRAELTSLQNMLVALAYAATPVTPPTDLRQRVLKAVSQKQAPVVSLEAARHRKESEASNPKPAVPATPRRWSGKVFPFAAAASIMLALMVGLVVVWNRLETTRSELKTVRAELLKEKGALEQERIKAAWLASPETYNTILNGTEVSPRSRAKLTVDPETGKAVLTVSGIPPTPAGKAYQIWYLGVEKNPIPGIVFTIDAQGRLELQYEVPAHGRKASTFAVTIEPAQGSSAPTGPMYLLGKSS